MESEESSSMKLTINNCLDIYKNKIKVIPITSKLAFVLESELVSFLKFGYLK